jgi:hypothetical protein
MKNKKLMKQKINVLRKYVQESESKNRSDSPYHVDVVYVFVVRRTKPLSYGIFDMFLLKGGRQPDFTLPVP